MRNNMSTIVGAFLQLGLAVVKLADQQEQSKQKHQQEQTSVSSFFTHTIHRAKKYVDSTFFTENKFFIFSMFENPEKRSFVSRNLTSIMLCFLFGNFFDGNVFSPYDAAMASTLSVLISHFTGSAIYRNLM